MSNKLALGTVQFGLDYGINNASGKVSIKDIADILCRAKKEKVVIIDTAQAYGNSEEILGNIGVHEFDVVTKFTALGKETTLKSTILSSLKRLKLKTLYGVLFHDFNYWKAQPTSWFELEKIKTEGLIKKIGFSLYHPEQWFLLKEKGIIPDLLQIPMNLLNQQFTPYFPEFKQAGIEIHVRSAFLQGLLLMEQENIPNQFLEIIPQLDYLMQLSKKLSVSKANICLLWLWQNHYVDHIVVGVDNLTQWTENLSSAEWCEKNSDTIKIDSVPFACDNQDIINPSKWNRA